MNHEREMYNLRIKKTMKSLSFPSKILNLALNCFQVKGLRVYYKQDFSTYVMQSMNSRALLQPALISAHYPLSKGLQQPSILSLTDLCVWLVIKLSLA